MHSDKQNLFLTTFKKWVLAKKSGQIPHSAKVQISTHFHVRFFRISNGIQKATQKPSSKFHNFSNCIPI